MALSGKLPNIRQLYSARPGYRLVHADGSQLELRVMAAISHDKVLRAALDSGDVYTEDAKAIFRLPAGTKKCPGKGPCIPKCLDPGHLKKAARQQAKIGHLAFQYGAGLPTFYSQMLEQDRQLTWNNAKFVFDGLRSRYVQTVSYWFEEQARVRSTGYSESRLMRRRRTYPREPPITEIANWPVQATAADHINLSMIALCGGFDTDGNWTAGELDKFGGEARLIIQFHDAFDVECKPEIVDDVKEMMRQCMEAPRIIEGEVWVFPVEIKTGFLWSEV